MYSFLKGQEVAQTAGNDDASTAQSQAALPVELLEHIILFLPALENLQLREVSNLFCSIWERVAKKQRPITIPAMRDLTPEQAQKYLHEKQQAEISYLTTNESMILTEHGLKTILDRLKFLKEKTSFLASHIKEKCLNSFNNTIIRNRIGSNPEVLYLSNSFLTRFPEEIFSDVTLSTFWTNHRMLFLDYNQLTTLPDAIGRCSNLRMLFVNNNQLTALPDAIGQCVALEGLLVSNNQLSTLPDTIGQCVALDNLSVGNNQLTTLPDAIGQCIALKTLYITNNDLITLPDSIKQCSLLRHLSITKNKLKELPANLPSNITFYDERSRAINKARCLELQKPAPVETEKTEKHAPKRRRLR